MYLGKKVSVVFPVYNEKENIRNAIEEFLQHPAVDELIAVDNNSKDGSAEEIQKTNARYVLEPTQGYGAAVRRGMREATGDLIVTVEPDGTFRAEDLDRFLVYSREYEVVLGTRTSRHPVWGGGDPKANMDFALRMGNWAVAKFLEYLYGGPSFTDVGCTYKLIQRHAYEIVKDTFTVDGNWFSPEYMIRVLQHRLSVVEIPVQYGARIGTSKITGKRSKAIALGFKMIWFIMRERFTSWSKPLLVLLGITLALTLIPLAEIVFFLGGSFAGILPDFSDELNFARLHTIGQGNITDGNPYFMEHATGTPLVIFGGAWLNAIPLWAGLPLVPALYLNFIFWSLVFASSAYWLLRELRAPPTLAMWGALVLFIESYEHVWRPVNLQPVYPFYFLLYIAILRFIRNQKAGNQWLLAAAIALSFYLFAYLWQIAVITLGLLFLYALARKDWKFAKATFRTSLIGGLLGLPVPLYMLYLSHTSPFFWESMGRLGLVNSHVPMAEVIYSGGWIGLLILALLISFFRVEALRHDADARILGLFIIVTGMGLWIMQGSNLITGKLLETGEHVRLLIAPWLLFSTIAAICMVWKHWRIFTRGMRVLILGALSILTLVNGYLTYLYFSPFLPSTRARHEWVLKQEYAKPFAWLNEHESKPVVVWSNPHNPLAENLPIYTSDYVLYAYWGMLELVPEGEIRERYLMTEYFNNPTVEDLKSDKEMSLYLGRHDYPHAAKTREREIKVCRILYFWNTQKDCGEILSPQQMLGDEFFEELHAKFQDDIKPHIRDYLAKYHVAYILKDTLSDTTYHPEELGGILVYSDTRYELYRLP